MDELIHLEPTLDMLAEMLRSEGIACAVAPGAGEAAFTGARLYAGQLELSPEVLYVVRPEQAARFPGDRFACAGQAAGRAGGLICPDCPADRLLDALVAQFDACRSMELRLDELVYRNDSMEALTELGAELLGNPICIHDDWFVMVARSSELPQVLPPDYIMASSKEFIPQIVVEDFKNDSEYLETYAYHTAQLWDSSPGRPPSLYVNLWEGSIYRGRLLVVRYHRSFRRLDYRLAELVAQRAMSLLGRKRLGLDRPHRSMDDIVFDLLQGRAVQVPEEAQLAGLLGWNRGDRLVCIRIESQQQGAGPVMEHALHSDLFRAFPNGYVMIADGQQCVVLNISREHMPIPMLSHRLSPLCRDYCLYAGISSPAPELQALNVAYEQAQVALDRAFRLRSDRWVIPFSDCALEYLLTRLEADMPLERLVAPELLQLMETDAEKGTQYFETLRTYLLNERDIPRTSAALIIHRTTLLYRLKKLQGVVSLNLDDPWRRLYLTLSLWILEHEGGRV